MAITAGPDISQTYWAIIIGAVGAIICTGAIRLLEIAKVDDVVGAVPAHLFAGIWGTLAAAIVGGASFGVQLIGVLSVGIFVFLCSWAIWILLDKTMGVRVSAQIEHLGQDAGELGIDAYPEFVLMPEEFDDD